MLYAKGKLQHQMLHAKVKALALYITRQSFFLPIDVTCQGMNNFVAL